MFLVLCKKHKGAKMITNPFYYGGAITDEHFCNRIQELKDLKQDIDAGLNILIYAPRRFGKTSFVLKTLDELKSTNTKYIFLDLMYISTQEEFINKYFNAIAQSLEQSSEKIVKFFKSIVKLRPNINVNFDHSGSPSFSLALSGEDKYNTLEDVMNSILNFAKDNKVVVILDEFQEIVNLELEAKLRSIIQMHSNKISYIFMGSKKSLLNQMFMDKSRPFYKSVKHFAIKEINKSSWYDFIIGKFNQTNKVIDKKYIDEIIAITKGFPYYTQQFAYEIWNITINSVTDEIFSNALKIIISREEDLFTLEWDNITPNQKKAIRIIIDKDGTNLYDEQYLAKYHIKTGSIQTALKALVQKDIIDKSEDKYYFQDPLFKYYVSNKN